MLSEVNKNNQGDSNPSLYQQLFSAELNGDEVLASSTICKQPSDKLSLIQQLYMEMLLPYMQSSGAPFVKVSRKTCPLLENSIWAHRNGSIFEQYHSKSQNGAITAQEKGLLGRGGYKQIWDLKPLIINSNCPEMARTRFHWDKMTDTLKERLMAIQELKDEIDSEYLLLPDTVMDINSKGKNVINQMVPKAAGRDIFNFLEDRDSFSYVGWLRILLRVGLGLNGMHLKGWAHLDVKPENIMLMNSSYDRDNPVTKLGDFDLARKFKEESKFYLLVGCYTDPKCLNYNTRGFEDAKIQDQFAFGILLCELLTGRCPRENVDRERELLEQYYKELLENKSLSENERVWKLNSYKWDLKIERKKRLQKWVTEEDLQAVKGFSGLNEEIQNMMRKCCLGGDRTYQLPEMVEVLKKLIDAV